MENQFEPMISNFLDESFSYIGGGRRKLCKAKGLKGKAFRDCLKELRAEDKGLSREEKKEKKKERKTEFNKALVEGKVEKGKVIRKLQKFNPSAIALRGTVITALRFNLFGNSTRLYPAFLTEEEAKEKNFDVENLPKAKEALNKVYAFYIKIGGDPEKALKNVIIKAHNKPIFKTKKAKARLEAEKQKGFDGSDETYSNLAEESIVAISTASAGVLASIISAVGARKNPYKKGSNQYKKFEKESTEKPTVPEGYQRVIKEAEQGAEQDKAKGLSLDGSDDAQTESKILGMPPMLAIGVFALVAIGGFFVIKKLMKNKSGNVATT